MNLRIVHYPGQGYEIQQAARVSSTQHKWLAVEELHPRGMFGLRRYFFTEWGAKRVLLRHVGQNKDPKIVYAYSGGTT